jgi:hypothetical protein
LKILRLLVVASIINILLLPTTLPAQKTSDDDASFRPYLSCPFDDGLKIVDTTHYPKSADNFRELDTSDGKRTVTRVDGYTVKFAYPNTDVFVNLKVEQSSPQSYAKDKETILEHMKWLLSRSKSIDGKELRQVIVNRIEVYGYDRNVLGLGIVMGLYVFFEDRSHKVITIYFLNQRPNKRQPQTIEEYRLLRDKFLNQYTRCVAGNQ